MRTRNELSGAEIEALYAGLDRRLDRLGLESRPEVALRILRLVSDPDAGVNDFARVIRNDQALTGRLLKTSNSAYFAQRRPVTSIDRACVILGMERIRALSLGFSLARASAPGTFEDLSRRSWGVSVYRGCLAAEISRASGGQDLAAEAFIIGLMLDVGVPLMHKMLGKAYEAVLSSARTPSVLFRGEFNGLPFTHVDVAAVLCRRWGLPELLTLPIEWRYVPPPDTDRGGEPLQRMQRVAYYAGAVSVNPDPSCPTEGRPMATAAERLFELDGAALDAVLASAAKEYRVAMTAFDDMAEAPTDTDAITRQAHETLAEIMADEVSRQLNLETTPPPGQFRFDGFELEVRSTDGGDAVAVLMSGDEPIVQHRFDPSSGSAEQLLMVMGIEQQEAKELGRLQDYLRQLAA